MAETTTILSLPPEILTQVVSNLNCFDLENVAKTFNQRLYAATVSMLKPQIPWLNNARAMCALFPPFNTKKLLPAFPEHIGPFVPDWSNQRDELEGYLVDKFGLRSKAPLYRSSPPDLRSWMNLDGTFWWLDAPNGSSSDRKEFSSVAEDWQIDVVIAQAKALGLALPVGYETFMRSRHLSYRIPSHNAWYYELGKLVPCPPEIDNGAGGYIQVFHFDQQSCAFAYLYLNKAGNHCVLYSDRELYDDNFDFDDPAIEATDVDEDTLKRKEKIDYSGTNADYHIVGLSFEEYLVGVYFEEQLNFANDPFPLLQDYIAHIYHSPAEVECLRHQSK